jgi:Sec-independent protein translocase protein TatA
MTLAVIFDSVGVGEWFILLAVVLIVLGPSRLPETARKFGNYYSKFRRAAESFKRQLMEMDTEITRAVDDAEKEIADASTIPEEAGHIDNPDYGPGYNDEFDYDVYGRAVDGYDEPEQDGSASAAESAEVASAAAPAVEEPKKTSVDRNAVKITVSPGPEVA